MNTIDVITNPLDLTPGSWYCIGFKAESDEIHWDGAPIYQYLGDKQWGDEHGKVLESFFDPILQLEVATDAPDGFLPA